MTNDKLENVKKITLIFASKPIELKKWIILDFQDIETTVSLLNIKEEGVIGFLLVVCLGIRNIITQDKILNQYMKLFH